MKSLIPEYVSGFRHAVINRLIDWARSQTIIVGPGLTMTETTDGTRIELAPETGPKITYMPFDVMLSWVDAASTNHILAYMPLGLNGWIRGAQTASAYDSLSTAATAAWPQANGKSLPDGWIDTGQTWKPGDGAMDIFAWVSTGGSFLITASPSLLAFNTSSTSAAQAVGLQRHIAQITALGDVIQFFDGLIDEIGFTAM